MGERIGYQEFTFAETRNNLVQEFERSQSKAVTYDLAFDRATYKDLAAVRLQPEHYEKKKTEVNGYTQTQLKTTLSERFNVLSSTIRYDIKDNVLYGENTDEPFINMLVRGREYRKVHGKPIDREREQAEVEGFSLIEAALCDQNASLGTMMVSVSPRGDEGSVYQHNFYDIYTLSEDENGRYIDFRRYSAGLTRDKFALKASELDLSYSAGQVPTDAEFLRKPIKLESKKSPFQSADEVHEYFHTEHDYMTVEEFESEILRYCAPLILNYINALCENPDASEVQGINFNSILNKSDLRAEIAKKKKQGVFIYDDEMVLASRESLEREVNRLGRLPVRIVSTGCGELGGVGVTMTGESNGTGPMSVSFFGQSESKNWSYSWGECVMCKDRFTQVGPCKICKSCEKKFD